MKKHILITSLLLLTLSCSKEYDPDRYAKNIIDNIGVDTDTHILHDTLKAGENTFKIDDTIQGDNIEWEIIGNNNTIIRKGREITVELTPGKYEVKAIADKGYTGKIVIPEKQEFSVDLDESHTLIAHVGSKTLHGYGKNSEGKLCVKSETTKLDIPSVLKSFNNVSQVATGSNHSLIVHNNNVYSCGSNSVGQLGTSQSVNNNAYIVNNIYSNKVSRVFVSAGGDISSAAVETMDTGNPYIKIFTWGFDNGKGQFEPSPVINVPSRREPILTSGNNFTVIRATSSYNVFSYGINNVWQLGRIDGRGINYAGTPADYDKYDTDKQIYKGLNKFDLDNGYVHTPYGENFLGDDTERSYYQNNFFGRIAAGKDFVISIKKEYKGESDDPYGGSLTRYNKYAVYVWGNNDKGQLGFTPTGQPREYSTRPTAIMHGKDSKTDDEKSNPSKGPFTFEYIIAEAKEVAAGDSHGFIIDSTGKLYGFGSNDSLQLTDDSNKTPNATNNAIYEIKAPNGLKFEKIWAGGNRSVALLSDGNLYTWGDNTDGVLGINKTEAKVGVLTKLFFKMAS